MEVERWDICRYFHGLNDFGFSNGGKLDLSNKLYGKSKTYSGECNSDNCNRNGLCVKARKRSKV